MTEENKDETEKSQHDGKRRPLNKREKAFARALAEGMGSIEAGRRYLRWACNPGSPQYQKVKDLARSPRIKEEIKKIEDTEIAQAQAQSIITGAEKINLENLRQFAYDRLVIIRDDKAVPATHRVKAVLALERLADPSKDVNLIIRWVNLIWQYYTAHCPSCHHDFPLWKIQNKKLDKYRKDHKFEEVENLETVEDRRIALIGEAEKTRYPHPGQLRALNAPERHIAFMGPARLGKSFCLALFALIFILQPGSHVWILSETYERAEPEFKYLIGFLETLFQPYSKHMFSYNMDPKSGEAWVSTKWGSAIEIKSGRAKGSITGHELEAGLVAEPAWVSGELYEELRARMSSRLGRIIAMGTPKGFGGFLYRMTKISKLDKKRNKIRNAEDRLVENGCPWSQSMLIFNGDPQDNPQYVKSELEAARLELTDEEYASEFEGRMVSESGRRFPYITDKHLIDVRPETYERCLFVQGIDQGPKNFGGCTIAWDGKNIFVSHEYFEKSEKTPKANLITLQETIPVLINAAGGSPDNWVLTIADTDPPIQGTFQELEDELRPWKTDITYKPKNMKDYTNWRSETCDWINEMVRLNRLFFDAKTCDILHDQLKDCLIKPQVSEKESSSAGDKGWIFQDKQRNDHVADAFLMACFVIFSQQIVMPTSGQLAGDPFQVARQLQDQRRIAEEREILSGYQHERFKPERKTMMDIQIGGRFYDYFGGEG